MISDERINQLAAESGLPLGVRDMHETAFALLARAIEREATAITDEMVERAAVAAFTYNRLDGDGPWDELPQKFQKYWRGAARAALEAALGVKHAES